MEIVIDKNIRIFILEGIAGAGKNTLYRLIKEQLSDRIVYGFAEEELLFTWKQAWVNNIDEMRLYFFENLLDYCEECLQENPDVIFIFNRFHISYAIFHSQDTLDKQNRYAILIERLKKMGAFIYVPMLGEEDIENRSIHTERVDPMWKKHLEKRLSERGCTSIREMYSAEQQTIQKILKEQGIPYQILSIDIPA